MDKKEKYKNFSKQHSSPFSRLILSPKTPILPIPSLNFPYFHHRLHSLYPNPSGEVKGCKRLSVMDPVCLSVHNSFCVPLIASDWFLPAKPCFLPVFLHHSLPLTGFPLLYFSLCHCTGVGHPQAAVPQECPCLFGLRYDCLPMMSQV